MALINCAECKKEISDKANACPNCGNPITKKDTLTKLDKELVFPNLPANLEIGKQIVNWGGNANIEGFYDKTENTIISIPNGKINIILHTHGIQLITKSLTNYPINNDQIISIKQASNEELAEVEKSVIGRAVIGGLILGPLGAVIGGISGVGSKNKHIKKHYVIINFWELKTKSAQTILISGDKTLIKVFRERRQKEIKLNKTSNRVAVKESIPTMFYLLIAIILIVVFVALLA